MASSEQAPSAQGNHFSEVYGKKFGIVQAKWNEEITGPLANSCKDILISRQIPETQISHKQVPGAFELPLGIQYMAEHGHVHAIIAIGCLIQGETPHFHYIADTVTQKIADLNLRYHLPVIYGVLTVNSQEQAKERAGGQHGNKGVEAAEAALEMLDLKASFNASRKTAGFQ